jgi:hypothetical protein
MLRWTGTDTVTIAPFSGAFPPFTPGDEKTLRRLAVCDTETLGLEPDAPVIEIALRVFAYDAADGRIRGALDEYGALQDPGVPVPAEITALTGITDDDVRGRAIDVERVRSLLSTAHVIIAHNAAFDRPRVDAIVGGTSVPWACTSTQIDWQALGLPAKSLGALCFGPYGWLLEDVVALRETVPCKGAQGLWTVPPDVAARVLEQVPEVVR